MRRVAFLTTDLAPGYVTDDHLAVPFLRERGVEASFVRWKEPRDWTGFDVVVVRSTWDYHHDPDGFLRTLSAIAAATRLENPLPLQRWNLAKTYLRDLDQEGVPVVPTVWGSRLQPGELMGLFPRVAADEIVLKPVVGSSGEDAFRVSAADAGEVEPALLRAFHARGYMVQPFLPDVLAEGEASVVWIDGRISHALRKTPRPGEFRSQEEHGGTVELGGAEGRLLDAAARIAKAMLRRSGDAPPLYARADFLPSAGEWLLGELELVEPSLYLRLDPAAPDRFARAVARRAAAGDPPE